MLVDYELSKDGNLELLYLKDVFRKKIDETNYKEVNGHTIVLKYENIININLTFVQSTTDQNGNINIRMVE